MNEYLIIAKHCLSISVGYAILYFILLFNEIFMKQKYSTRMYIVKNFLKSFILFYIAVNMSYDLLSDYLEGITILDNNMIRIYGSLYVSNDIVALIVVRRLPLTTKIHHTVTTLLLLYFFTLDINDYSNIGILILVYSFFSIYAFTVNFYLAARYFRVEDRNYVTKYINKNRYIDNIRHWSYYIYALLCAINWTINSIIYMVKIYNNTLNWEYILYAVIMSMIIRDDLILMDWLKNKSRIVVI